MSDDYDKFLKYVKAETHGHMEISSEGAVWCYFIGIPVWLFWLVVNFLLTFAYWNILFGFDILLEFLVNSLKKNTVQQYSVCFSLHCKLHVQWKNILDNKIYLISYKYVNASLLIAPLEIKVFGTCFEVVWKCTAKT